VRGLERLTHKEGGRPASQAWKSTNVVRSFHLKQNQFRNDVPPTTVDSDNHKGL
jgi:hypothetical protein